jgi:glycerol-3-phosphate dehydrogenase
VSSFTRAEALASLERAPFDVVVVGGGMTGTGVALDAALRGLRVALVEAGDIAAGTSSKSSKMVHGGLRYLQQREFRLVYENLRERQRLIENAPHLVRPLPFLIPLFGRDGVVSRSVTRAYATALWLYDVTGGWRIGQRHRRVSRAEALAHLPTLDASRLVAGFLYPDARGDDARVALTLARSAADAGAVVATYTRAVGLERDADGAPVAVTVADAFTGERRRVATRAVVNAAGVWTDVVANLEASERAPRVTPAKGVHVTVASERLPADIAAVLPVPGDRRSVFVVPFEEAPYTFIGTTDTAYDGPLDTPRCTGEDVAYLLRAVNAATSSKLTPQDVTGVWAGLRPLLAPTPGEAVSARTADLSRRHRVTVEYGVVTITGGKWTTYRQMAEDAVDALGPRLGRQAPCSTAHHPLHGARGDVGHDAHLARRYGADAPAVAALAASDPTLAERPLAPLPYLGAEFLYGARTEMAVTLEDLLCRRTRAHLQDARATRAGARRVAEIVAGELGWDSARVDAEVAAYERLVDEEFGAAALPR